MCEPFRHWRFEGALTESACRGILALPIEAPRIDETYGKRDSHNDLRRFFSPEMRAQFPVVRDVAETFQSEQVARAIESFCGADFRGSYLRIEYCQDRSGFWLEPHMDIKEKRITIQIYLNEGEGADALGTDLYDRNKRWHSRTPSTLNQGMAFLPQEPYSFHGVEKHSIARVRRSLIINYVSDDWRSRHELSFPDRTLR